MTNESLRIAGRCKDLTFYEQLPKGTVWHGDGMWIMKQMESALQMPFEVVPAYLSGNAMLRRMANGSLDVLPDTFGMTHQRFQLVDFFINFADW